MTPRELADMLKEHFRLDVSYQAPNSWSSGMIKVELKLRDEERPSDIWSEETILVSSDSIYL